jgi:hypothetical protein
VFTISPSQPPCVNWRRTISTCRGFALTRGRAGRSTSSAPHRPPISNHPNSGSTAIA